MSTVHASPLAQVVVELCAETTEACSAGTVGGAHRIELCTDLDVGGLTPPPELVKAALAHTALPVHVLLRPTADTFIYSPRIHQAIEASLHAYKASAVAGFVLGLLTPEHQIDVEHTRRLVALAHPLPITFHRAFDQTPDLPAALEQLIAAGCSRVLTSGGAADVVAGASALAALVEQAGDRIQVAAGGGLRLANATSVAQQTRARHFHASLRKPEPVRMRPDTDLAARTAELVRLLTHASQPAPTFYTTAGTGTVPFGSRAGR